MSDRLGKLFSISTWGESHGPIIGVVIDGCPSMLKLEMEKTHLSISGIEKEVYHSELIQRQLDRRRPGQSSISTQRKESDKAYFVSGIFEGKTTGAPITAICINQDNVGKDYNRFKNIDRPGHAGFTYRSKYGIYDYEGGGRASYRETWGRVVAGSIAKIFLSRMANIQIIGYVSQVGAISTGSLSTSSLNVEEIESNPIRCPDVHLASMMEEEILRAKKDGNSLGGKITAVVKNMPIGLGEPVFDKLDADLFKALKSIHATKAVEIGEGIKAATMTGEKHNDKMQYNEKTKHLNHITNHAGGVLGGISNGEELIVTVTFKPTATIEQEQKTVNHVGKPKILVGKGRHDPCVVPRAVVTVESMIALVLMDHYLLHKGKYA